MDFQRIEHQIFKQLKYNNIKFRVLLRISAEFLAKMNNKLWIVSREDFSI